MNSNPRARVEMRFAPTRFALRSRSFGIFAAGNLVSQAGAWMTLVALNWGVVEFTGSALYLGLINACRMVPAFLLSVPAGVLADRSDRRKLLILLQAGIMVSTFCVGYLLAADTPFWMLVVVVTAIAGTLLAVMEVADVFWISACSIVAVLLSLLVVHPESNREAVSNNIKADIQEAAVYVKNSPSVQSLLILAVVPMVFAFPYTAMMPLFAEDLLQLGPEGLGVLLSVAGGRPRGIGVAVSG